MYVKSLRVKAKESITTNNYIHVNDKIVAMFDEEYNNVGNENILKQLKQLKLNITKHK
jgi:hypothetical protein